MDEREYNNIKQVFKLFEDIIAAIYASDMDRLKEVKGELRAMESIVTPLEFSMGMMVGAIREYQRKTKEFEDSQEEGKEENESKRKK